MNIQNKIESIVELERSRPREHPTPGCESGPAGNEWVALHRLAQYAEDTETFGVVMSESASADAALPVPPEHLASEPQPLAPLNTWAMVSFILAFVATIPSIVVGIVALREIRLSGERGRGWAIAGIVISASLTFLLWILALVFIGITLAAIYSQHSQFVYQF